MAHVKKEVPEKLMFCHPNPESQARKLGSGFGIHDQAHHPTHKQSGLRMAWMLGIRVCFRHLPELMYHTHPIV